MLSHRTPAVRVVAFLILALGPFILPGPPWRAGVAVAAGPVTARALLDAMAPAQRVGQLFLVPFHGASAGDAAGIGRLIDRGFVGGVVLDPANGNFTNAPDAPSQVARLANALQARAAGADGPYVPLFVTLSTGGPYPYSALHGGLNPLPSPMALGATWQPELAAQVGERYGRELAGVGVNMVLGPSLDVTSVPRPGSSGDLGVRVFGGSPSWAGRIGRAYIEGLHRGSAGRLATVAANFPGIGGADRSAQEEGAVVEGTLAQLLALELTPFVTVTDGRAGRPEGLTDALLTSHVRYRGIQQQTDPPLSLDSGGLRHLWAQVPALAGWRDAGGVVVSAGLGLPAVRRYDDSNLTSFNIRRVVREALLAGNDMLTLTAFGSGQNPTGDPAAETANIEAAVDWLGQAYLEDGAIRQAVDEAAERILSLKLKLYKDVVGPVEANLEGVRVDEAAAGGGFGQQANDAERVAASALTLITAASSGTAGQQGSAPQIGTTPRAGERLLYVVDAREVRECADCPPYPSLDPEQVTARTWKVYGSEGSGVRLVRDRADLAAITFNELKAWLQSLGRVTGENTPSLVAALPRARLRQVAALVADADWIVFALRDLDLAAAPGADALKLFLKANLPRAADRPQHLVAIAFDAPYYLDTTEIAKLDAYYAVYARTDPFVDIAIRAVFGDAAPAGSSPVSVPGAGYELAQRLEPAPTQPLTLELVGRDPHDAIGRNAVFTVRSGVIVDANGRPVRDGTPVRFRQFHRVENVYLPDVPVSTLDGRATAEMRVDRLGELEIQAALDNGLVSTPLPVTISLFGQPSLGPGRPSVLVDWGILFLSLALMLLAGVFVYGVDNEAGRTPGRLVRLLLLSMAWGLVGYLLVAAGGMRLAVQPGAGGVWPEHWSLAYQAPLFSFVFASLPVVPTLVRAVRRNLS